MAVVQKGIAVRWGIANVSFTGITLVNDASKIQSLEFNRASDKKDIRDAVGEVAGSVFYNAKKTITLAVIPAAATGANMPNALNNVTAWLPAPGTLITAADTDGAFLDAASAATYNCLSAKARMTNDSEVVCDLELERFDANEVATAANT